MIRDVARRRTRVPRWLLRNARAHFYQYLTTQAAASAPPEDVLRRLWLTLRVDPARVGVPHLWRIACMNALAWGFGAVSSTKPAVAPRRTLSLDAVASLQPRDLPTLTRLYRAPGQVRWSWRPFDWIERRRWHRTCESTARGRTAASYARSRSPEGTPTSVDTIQRPNPHI